MEKSAAITAIITLCLFALASVASAQDDPREGRKCPCRIISDHRDGLVKLINRDGFSMKIYPQASYKDTIEIYQTNDEFYVLRASYWVSVYEITTGKPVRRYMADKKARNWVR